MGDVDDDGVLDLIVARGAALTPCARNSA